MRWINNDLVVVEARRSAEKKNLRSAEIAAVVRVIRDPENAGNARMIGYEIRRPGGAESFGAAVYMNRLA
jgi:hypothetical protein